MTGLVIQSMTHIIRFGVYLALTGSLGQAGHFSFLVSTACELIAFIFFLPLVIMIQLQVQCDPEF